MIDKYDFITLGVTYILQHTNAGMHLTHCYAIR